jgi:hypothetical protein
MAVLTVTLEDQGVDRSVPMCSHVIKAMGHATGRTHYRGGVRIRREKILVPCPNRGVVVVKGRPYCKSHAPPSR